MWYKYPWHILRMMASCLGIPGKPAYVTPHGSAGETQKSPRNCREKGLLISGDLVSSAADPVVLAG